MRYILILTVTVLINSSMSILGHSNTLNEMRWHKRLIVAFATEARPATLIFKNHVEAASCDLAERHVDFYLIEDMAAIAYTSKALPMTSESILKLQSLRSHTTSPFEMLLIGKDGGLKATSLQASDLNRFLDLIDGMPMRRAEAAQQQSPC